MKQVKFLAAALFIGGALSIMSSCKDPCKDVTCENGGTCNEGTCECATGYEGTNCESAWSDKFLGTASGDDDCGFLYESTFSSTTDNTLSISNAFGTLTTASADVISSTELQIASQTNSGWTYSGSGTITNKVITIDYQLDDGTTTSNCTVTYTLN